MDPAHALIDSIALVEPFQPVLVPVLYWFLCNSTGQFLRGVGVLRGDIEALLRCAIRVAVCPRGCYVPNNDEVVARLEFWARICDSGA